MATVKTMKYTKEQYKAWINQFCDEKDYPDNIRKKLLNEDILKADILNEDIDIIGTLSELIIKGGKTYQTLRGNRAYFNNLMKWFYQKKMISVNPFDKEDDRLSSKDLRERFKEKLDLRTYKTHEVEKMISKVRMHLEEPDMCELLIRLFYEGVPSINFLGNIRNSDIEGNKIKNKDINITMSPDLTNIVKIYQDLEEIKTPKITYSLITQEDRLIKYAGNQVAGGYDNRRFQVRISSNYFNQKISKAVGYKVYPRDLFFSGFINYFKSQVKNKDEFYNTFFGVVSDRIDKYTMERLSEAMFQYNGTKIIGWKIRENCLIYL